MLGNLMSMRTTSGLAARIWGNASSAETKAPRHFMSGADSRIWMSCSRSPLSSSTMTTDFFMKNITNVRRAKRDNSSAGNRRLHAQTQADRRSLTGFAFNDTTAADILQTLLHIGKPVARNIVRRLKSGAVVMNRDL